jgi:uncharacterized protein YbjQ (UPF0145 family)
MSSLNKYIQMLSSPDINIRYEACEELRVGNESSEEAVIALERLLGDKDKDVVDAARRALNSDVHMKIITNLRHESPDTQVVQITERERNKLQSIIIVTTPSIDGKRISEYLGIISVEAVLKIDPASDILKTVSGFLSDRVTAIQNRYTVANNEALMDLRRKAHELDADAIVGVNIEYSVLGNNKLGLEIPVVLIYGTAVKIKDSQLI